MASPGGSAREIQEQVERALRSRQTDGSRYLILLAGVGGVLVAIVVGTLVLFLTGEIQFTADGESDSPRLPAGTGPVSEAPGTNVPAATAKSIEALAAIISTDMAPTSEAPGTIGPVTVEGIYCWGQDTDSTERLRFVIFNPTDKELTVRVPHGPLRVGPGQMGTSGTLDMGSETNGTTTRVTPIPGTPNECKYKFLVEEGELTATSNPRLVIREFVGVRLEAPRALSLELVKRLLDDLLAADLDSIEGYTDTSELRMDLVALIAWRSTARPVRVEIAHCSPEFFVSDPDRALAEPTSTSTDLARTTDTVREPMFIAEFWLCDLAVRYASTASGTRSSGVWSVKVKHDLVTGVFVVIPSNP